MLIHIRDDDAGGALCEEPAARPVLDVRAIVALRPPTSSRAAVCVACIVAGDFYMPGAPPPSYESATTATDDKPFSACVRETVAASTLAAAARARR